MSRVLLLEQLKLFTEAAIKDLILPTRQQKDDEEQVCRPADVYRMRLPDSTSAQKKAPYIIHQLVTSKDIQTPGNYPEGSCLVRSVFCVYHENEEEGGLALLNLQERLRIELLKKIIVGGQYQLVLSEGLEALIYPDDSAPYYLGEMMSTWTLPPIKREVNMN